MSLRSLMTASLCLASVALGAPDAGSGRSTTEGEISAATGTKLQLRTGKDTQSTFALGPDTTYAGPGLRTWGDLQTGRWVRVTWSGTGEHRRAVRVESLPVPVAKGTTMPDRALIPGGVPPTGPELPASRQTTATPVGTGSETSTPTPRDETPVPRAPSSEVPSGMQPPRPEPH